MIFLDKESKRPLYIQLYSKIKRDILAGELREEQILPGSRSLAHTLQVSRNTVDNAYSQLVAEGYICAKKGIGYAVVKVPELRKGGVKKRKENIKSEEKEPAQVPIYDLTNSSHTSDLFPKELWRKYTTECLDRLEQEAKISAYQDKQGERYLRQTLLAYLRRIRGVHCEAEQIIITCGIQQSLEYICKILPQEKAAILMEEPGYNKAVTVFNNNNREVWTVPVDEYGISVTKLPETEKIAALYTTPSHQFPTGVTLPIDRRFTLLEWAKRNKTYIIEDDFDSEQRYYARPIPSLQSIDVHDSVIYLGTFSKGLSPSVRMSYMILPPPLLRDFYKKFEFYNCTVPLLNQYVIGRIIETGNYDRHIRRLNHIFRKRLEEFSEAFLHMSDKIKISSNGTGQYFLLEFRENVSQKQLMEKALEQGVRVYSTMEFWQDKAECPANTLFLGFSKIRIEDISDCVDRLKTAWKEWI